MPGPVPSAAPQREGTTGGGATGAAGDLQDDLGPDDLAAAHPHGLLVAVQDESTHQVLDLH